jgi:hypothetical protein
VERLWQVLACLWTVGRLDGKLLGFLGFKHIFNSTLQDADAKLWVFDGKLWSSGGKLRNADGKLWEVHGQLWGCCGALT